MWPGRRECRAVGNMEAGVDGASRVTGGQAGAMDDDRLDGELLDALSGLIAHLLTQGEEVARRLSIPAVFIKALHLLDAPVAMKEVGRRLNCDPSFVTSIADMLEQRGLATRQSDPADRRVKRLVLTPEGRELKARMEREVHARLPWRQVLDHGERACLLGLIRKMFPPGQHPAGPATAADATNTAPAGEVSTVLTSGPPRG